MKSALETGTHLPTKHPAVTWMVEYAAHLLNRFEVGQVGDSALHHELAEPGDIRVEVTLKEALKFSERSGPDVAQIFSQFVICQEASGQHLTP